MTSPPRFVRKQTVVSISPETAWKTWTTIDGVTSFFAPKANIDPNVGGPYELFFDLKAPRGFQGTEGCKVLKGGLVKVSLVHSGFVEGEEWDESFDFYSWSWDLVLGRFQHRFSAGPIDWNHPYWPSGIAARPQRKLRDHLSSQIPSHS